MSHLAFVPGLWAVACTLSHSPDLPGREEDGDGDGGGAFSGDGDVSTGGAPVGAGGFPAGSGGEFGTGGEAQIIELGGQSFAGMGGGQ